MDKKEQSIRSQNELRNTLRKWGKNLVPVNLSFLLTGTRFIASVADRQQKTRHTTANKYQKHQHISLMQYFCAAECSEEHPCEGLNEHAHFRDFGMAFLTLFRVATGDNWNGIMKVTSTHIFMLRFDRMFILILL